MTRITAAVMWLVTVLLYPVSAGFLAADSNTVALWRFDEGQGNIVRDCSGNQNDGTIYGAQWCDGLYGIALDFDGTDDYVSVPHSASIVSPTGAITVEAFVWVDSFNVLNPWSHVLDKPHTYAISFNDGTPALSVCGVGSECWWAPRSYVAPCGKWIHFAAQFDGKKRQIYINDSLVAESAATGTIGHLQGYPLSDLVIGAGNLLELRTGSTGHFFNGKIDEVRISKVARYGQNQMCGFFKPDAHTIALYRFDEGEGTVVHDMSGNGNNGTIVGAQWSPGLFCNALSFNGKNSYVSVPHSTSLVSVSNAITLESFVFVSAFNGLSEWTHIMDKPHTYAISFNSGTPAVSLCGVGSECWWAPNSFNAATGKWMHVAAQYDGQKRQIYINDSLVAESYAAGRISHLSGYPLSDLVIGAGNLLSYRVGSTGYFFNGLIDETRISDIARYGKPTTAVSTVLVRNRIEGSAVASKSNGWTISYNIGVDDPVTLDIFNLDGVLVKSLSKGTCKDGIYSCSWDGRNSLNRMSPSGHYFVRLKTAKKEVFLKFIFLR
jgi:hypothetical protein